MELTTDFKEKVAAAVQEQRNNFDGSDSAYAKQLGISGSVYSRMKKGERERILRDEQWVNIGMKLNVKPHESEWKTARTEVFKVIEEDVLFCKENSKSMICVEDVGIGKTHTAKYLSRNIKNCFYIDAKQAKTKQQFVRLIARTIGVESTGRYFDVKSRLKYYLQLLPQPIVIIDDSGYLEYPAYMELLELWDATEGVCGWYQIGDDSLREKISRGINNKKVGSCKAVRR